MNRVRNIRKDKPKVAIIYTGGTISSVPLGWRRDSQTPPLVAAPTDVLAIVRQVHPEIDDIADIGQPVQTMSLLSEDIGQPGDWALIAQSVVKQIHEGAHGVVILHGTDTIDYSAAALSFALRNVPIPVFLTGSSRPVAPMPRNEGVTNVVDAITAAAKAQFAGIYVVYSHKIHLGTRVRKEVIHKDRFVSVTPGFRAFAQVTDGEVRIRSGWQPQPRGNPASFASSLDEFAPANVTKFVWYYPGFEPSALERELTSSPDSVRAVLLALYDTGTASTRGDFDLRRTVIGLREKGIVSFAVSQHSGVADMASYKGSVALRMAGVVPLYDMTPTAAIVKLRWTLSRGLGPVQLIDAMLSDIAGEISPGFLRLAQRAKRLMKARYKNAVRSSRGSPRADV